MFMRVRSWLVCRGSMTKVKVIMSMMTIYEISVEGKMSPYPTVESVI